MRRCAILVIAALNQAVYKHYIDTYWTSLIRYVNTFEPLLDVYLLFQPGNNLSPYSHLEDNIILDQNSDFNGYFQPNLGNKAIPGILSKTIFALEKLQNRYDLFFRTNLSSMIHLNNFKSFVQNKESFTYSGQFVWHDALRNDLILRNKIGPDKSIKSVEELNEYIGNTFISGSGFFLGSEEVNTLINNKKKIRYDIIDDVSIGLMMPQYESLQGFTKVLRKKDTPQTIEKKLLAQDYVHVRIQHFPLELAQELWRNIPGEIFFNELK